MSLDEIVVIINPEDLDVVVESVPEIKVDVDPYKEILVIAGNNIGPQGPQGPPGVGTFRTGRTWAVAGELSQAPPLIPPIFVPEATGENTTLIAMRAVLLSGTSVRIQMQKNGADLGPPITVTTIPISVPFSEPIVDLDMLGWTRSDLVDDPSGLSLTAIFEHVA